VKHYATNHNLSREASAVIKNAQEFATTVQNYVPSINLIFVPDSDVAKFRSHKMPTWEQVRPVVGIQKCHRLLSQMGKIRMSRTVCHALFEPEVIGTKYKGDNFVQL
jgi:hypothetical protein